jgi:hypothetical protein
LALILISHNASLKSTPDGRFRLEPIEGILPPAVNGRSIAADLAPWLSVLDRTALLG